MNEHTLTVLVAAMLYVPRAQVAHPGCACSWCRSVDQRNASTLAQAIQDAQSLVTQVSAQVQA